MSIAKSYKRKFTAATAFFRHSYSVPVRFESGDLSGHFAQLKDAAALNDGDLVPHFCFFRDKYCLKSRHVGVYEGPVAPILVGIAIAAIFRVQDGSTRHEAWVIVILEVPRGDIGAFIYRI